MKKNLIKLAVLLAILIAVFFIFKENQKIINANDSNSSNKDFTLDQSFSGPGLEYFRSETYGFNFRIDKWMQYTVGEPYMNADFSIGFNAPNPDSSQTANRETPNQFNLSDQNSFALNIYRNDSQITTDNLGEFKSWLNKTVYQNDQGDMYDNPADGPAKLNIRDLIVLKTAHPDGIDSYQLLYFVIGKNYIYSFVTNDFPETDMRSFISGFYITENTY